MSEPQKQLPGEAVKKLQEIISGMESKELAADKGEVNFRLSRDQMMWEVSYKTGAEMF